MTAREMHPDEVPHEYVMAAMKAAGLLHHDTARPALAAVLPLHRAKVLREAADFVDNDDTCECGGCDTCQPRKLANQLRELADATTPTSKEQRDGA